MGTGIMICGLNGAGKSTLGKKLAEELKFCYIDNEKLYFPETDYHNRDAYGFSNDRKEAIRLLLCEIKKHESFVFTSVKGDYGEAVTPFFQYIIVMETPKDIRLQRVKNRSFQKFGDRMLPGGDLYEQEKAFLDFVESRAENTVEDWVQSLKCPVIRVDGTKPVEENVALIIEMIQK